MAPVHAPQAPLAHVCEPCLHAPRLLPHVWTAPFVHEHPSSAVPSQSSSMPSHTSGRGATPPAHAPHAPFAHVCVPCLHAPRLLPHACTVPFVHEHPSSAVPSQSSSTPLHVSGRGSMAPTHTPQAPLVHVCVPCLHAPRLVPHTRIAPFAHEHPSSTTPLQLLSMPSHT